MIHFKSRDIDNVFRKVTPKQLRETLRIWIDSNVWIGHFHLNGYQKKSPGLPVTSRPNTHALSTVIAIRFT
jgi:hypothetical protein